MRLACIGTLLLGGFLILDADTPSYNGPWTIERIGHVVFSEKEDTVDTDPLREFEGFSFLGDTMLALSTSSVWRDTMIHDSMTAEGVPEENYSEASFPYDSVWLIRITDTCEISRSISARNAQLSPAGTRIILLRNFVSIYETGTDAGGMYAELNIVENGDRILYTYNKPIDMARYYL